MSPEELKQIIQETIRKASLMNALIPVIVTLIINTGYDLLRRKSESKKKYNIEKLQNLYLTLYSYISQSEYIKFFLTQSESKAKFRESSFITITKKSINETFDNKGYKKEIKEVSDDVTEVNMLNLVKTILNNDKYASTKLLKLSSAYLFLESSGKGEKYKTKFDEEFIKLEEMIVKTIIFETNECLKFSGFSYNKLELKTKIMDKQIWNYKKELDT